MKEAIDQDVHIGKWIAGAALGALAMYLLDPDRGGKRRAQSGHTLRELGRQTGGALDKVVRGLGGRMDEAGVSMRAGSDAMPGHHASGGGATPAGAVPSAADLAPAGRGTASSLLSMAAKAAPSGARWNSGLRGAAMAGGGALGLYGLVSSRSPLGLLMGLGGLALLARGASNQPLRSILGAASQEQAVEVQKTIRIDAAPEQVYDMFANYENFPRYMSNVVEVRDLGEGRSHWVVKGPAGTESAWNAVLTEQTRPRRLAWESEPGAEVQQTGTIWFEPFRNGTRVTVHMSYRPPAGAVGHALASLLGSDPKRQMDEDLARMKNLVERGAMTHAGAPSAAAENKFLH